MTDVWLSQVPGNPQDVPLGEEHLPGGPAQTAPDEETPLLPQVQPEMSGLTVDWLCSAAGTQ